MSDQFKFITYNHPDDAKVSSTRYAVRSAALRYHYAHSTRARGRANEIVLDVTSLIESNERKELTVGDVAFEDTEHQIHPVLVPPLFGGVDPSLTWPINDGSRERTLYSHRKFRGIQC